MTWRYREWHRNLSVRSQLLVSLLLNMAFWFIGPLLWNTFIWERNKPMPYYLFYAVFMGLVWTIYFNWSKIKKILTDNKV